MVQNIGVETAYLFLGMLNTGCNLIFRSECFILGRIDLILSEHRKSGFDTQLLDSDLARRHGAGVNKVGVKPAENPQKKTIKS